MSNPVFESRYRDACVLTCRRFLDGESWEVIQPLLKAEERARLEFVSGIPVPDELPTKSDYLRNLKTTDNIQAMRIRQQVMAASGMDTTAIDKLMQMRTKHEREEEPVLPGFENL